jgi:cytochrome bd-type quinol oxidase subunit 2
MSLFALATWITAAAGGLYLLSIWLIEYDKEFQAAAATRLPPPVLAGHVLLAIGGLAIWIAYLVYDARRLVWVALVALVLAATLGFVMAVRWVAVYRAGRAAAADRKARQASHLTMASGSARVAVLEPPGELGPPERNFPLPVVTAHGAFAAVTITLVLLTALGVGGG